MERVQMQVLHLNNRNKSNVLYRSHLFRLVRVQAGRAVWAIAGERYCVAEGDYVLLNNEEYRMLVDIAPAQDLVLHILSFEPPFASAAGFLPLYLRRPAGFSHRARISEMQSIAAWAIILVEHTSSKPFAETLVACATLQLLSYIARAMGPTLPPMQVPEALRMAQQYLDAHYTEALTLASLAAMAHMHPSAFSKAFARYNGIGLSQYIQRKRIALAVRLLEDTRTTVLDVALAAGFGSSANFYKAFHKVTGHAPRARNGQ